MKISGEAAKKAEKANFFRKQSVISLVLYAAFDIIYGKIFGNLFGMLDEISDEKVKMILYNRLFSGISPAIAIVAVVLIGYFILKWFANRQEEQISLQILREDPE